MAPAWPALAVAPTAQALPRARTAFVPTCTSTRPLVHAKAAHLPAVLAPTSLSA